MKGNKRIVESPEEVFGPPLPPPVESLVPDARARVSPSEMVDCKLACQLGREPRGNLTGGTDGAVPPDVPGRQPASRESPR